MSWGMRWHWLGDKIWKISPRVTLICFPRPIQVSAPTLSASYHSSSLEVEEMASAQGLPQLLLPPVALLSISLHMMWCYAALQKENPHCFMIRLCFVLCVPLTATGARRTCARRLCLEYTEHREPPILNTPGEGREKLNAVYKFVYWTVLSLTIQYDSYKIC